MGIIPGYGSLDNRHTNLGYRHKTGQFEPVDQSLWAPKSQRNRHSRTALFYGVSRLMAVAVFIVCKSPFKSVLFYFLPLKKYLKALFLVLLIWVS